MCTPLALAGAALTVGSTVANSIAASNVQKARNNAMAAERVRQNALESEANALNTQSQDRYQDFSGQQDQKAADLGQFFAGQNIDAGNANADATQQMVTPQSGSNIVVAEENKQRAKARDFTDNEGQALGKLRSFGDLIGDIGRSQARDASQIGQIGGFMRGSQGVLPLELDAANHKGDSLNLLGDVLGLGGSLALGSGLSGGGLGSSITNYATHTAFPVAPAMPVGAIAARAPSNLYSLYGNSTGLF